jgi:hypothetical protein
MLRSLVRDYTSRAINSVRRRPHKDHEQRVAMAVVVVAAIHGA